VQMPHLEEKAEIFNRLDLCYNFWSKEYVSTTISLTSLIFFVKDSQLQVTTSTFFFARSLIISNFFSDCVKNACTLYNLFICFYEIPSFKIKIGWNQKMENLVV